MADLTGKTILVTRPAPRGQFLCELIEAHHGRALFFPTIVFAPPPNQLAFQTAISHLHEHDWLIFISPQAVLASVDAIHHAYPNGLTQVKIAAIGAGTTQTLQTAGFTVSLQPDEKWHSEGLLQLPTMQSVAGQSIAIMRGVGGREKVDQVLAERGAIVTSLFAYERVLPEINQASIAEVLNAENLHAAICTSFQGVLNLKTLMGEKHWSFLQKIPLLVMSERIKSLAEDLGFQTIWVTPQASDAAILETLIAHSS